MSIRADVVIIGGGIVGTSIARELSKYPVDTVLVEEREDLARGASGANSGIVHAGYDPVPGTLMAKYNVKGCSMYPELSRKLHFPYSNVGSFVLAFSEEEMEEVNRLYQRGLINGVPDMEVISGEEARKLDPQISDAVVGALYAKSAGIVSPYEATIAFAENAAENGVRFFLEEKVTAIRPGTAEGKGFTVTTTKNTYEAGIVINCAGRGAAAISEMAGAESFPIVEKRGEYTLYDRTLGGFVSHVLFQCPNQDGKGILVTPTAEGNLLIGPNSIALSEEEKGTTYTTQKGQDQIFTQAQKTCPKLPFGGAITGFAGIRAVSGSDFIIGPSKVVSGFIQVAGICSPGLTSAPAIAEDVAAMALGALKESGVEEAKLQAKAQWKDTREGIPTVREMSWEEREALCKEDPDFGRIVCRCETVTEGQIRRALRSKVPVYTVDGVKRRTRAGMGRCQGSFCTPKVMQLISEESGIPFDKVRKACEGTEYAQGQLKGV